MRNFIVKGLLGFLWSALLSIITMLVIWIIFKDKKDIGTIAMYFFYTSFIYLAIGIANTIGTYRARGDFNYQQARTISSQSGLERSREDILAISKFYRLSSIMYTVGLILFLTSYFILSGYEPNLSKLKPPLPTVTVNEREIPVTLRDYSVRQYGMEYRNVELSTEEIAKSIIPTKVDPHSKLVVKFNEEPKRIFIGQLNQPFGLDRMVENMVFLSKEEGKYIYELHVEWDEKNANYVLVVQIDSSK
ncbi:hypothetical protein TEPIDINF_000686 [Tepidibacillus infernus]|uniref:Uncharacterized protein n=1 Tax=Tepidibacillus decaturensis TaxID=1413211 RepID=A0A135L2W6_9BACI|nr:hypothetical protein [Tepidibacillus decaturensis]KXG43321.1 hypothetical protein U473_04300 [Tepidibacillus decaturensis]